MFFYKEVSLLPKNDATIVDMIPLSLKLHDITQETEYVSKF